MTNVTPTTSSRPSPRTRRSHAATGKNTIAEGVVEKVAGIAAREVPGVHDLGNGAARAIGAIRNAINQQDRGQGIKVEVGEKQVAADIIIVAEYPVELQKVADSVRAAVTEAISHGRRHGGHRGQRDRLRRLHPLRRQRQRRRHREPRQVTPTTKGMLIGAVLALAAVAFGFWAMILVAVAIAIGCGVGRVVEGKLDVAVSTDALRGRRSS